MRFPAAAALSLLLPSGCGDESGKGIDDPPGGDTSDTGDDTGGLETACPEAEARLGYPACEHAVADDDAFLALTIASSSVDQIRVGKYMVPAVDEARLPPVFIYVDAFPLHYDFLVTAFPDLFSGLTTAEYEALILYPDTREFYAGTHSVYLDDEGTFYGFTVWDDPADAASTVTMEQVAAAWEILQDRFAVGELYWVPNSAAQQEAADGWSDPPFPIRDLAEVEYEAYNVGEGYGTLRLYTLDEFETATEEVAYGYQDILVIEEAPVDVERVVSGIVTGTRQGDLSHLNVRSAARGTPNCYLAEPLDALADWKDRLVRFECGETTWTIEEATKEEAAAWWESIRPDPVEVCAPDTSETGLPGLLDVPTESEEERDLAGCRFGSKGANLAALYQRIDEDLTQEGFLVPFAYYQAFMAESTWTVDLGAGEAEYSFEDTILAWHADPAFTADPVERRSRLEALRAAMKASELDPAVLALIGDRIVEVYGSDEVMARLRSSSNAEDSLGFSGAGLYESESACVADETDGDTVGPSRCDDDKPDEETLTDAVLQVWSSLWNMQAWDERDWYGIDHTQVAMGILVNPRSNDEQANIVAFSGNPTSDGDDRYLINAQEGELEVVSADPGVFPESILVTVEDGEVTEILRVSDSSEVDEVLTDAEVIELAEAFWEITLVFPQDDDVPKGRDVLWDTEWKILSDGRLVIKQIRPFLR